MQLSRHTSSIPALSDELMILISENKDILFINKKALALYKWEHEEVIGKSLSDLLEASDVASPLPKDFSPIIKNGSWDGIETHHNHSEETIILWKILFHKDNQSNEFLLIGKDMTVLHQAQQEIKHLKSELKKANRRIFELDHVIAQAPGNLYWYKKDLTYLGCNENSAKTLNMSRQEVVGKNLISLVNAVKTTDDTFVQTMLDHAKQVIETGKPLLNIEEPPFYGANGTLSYCVANKVPLHNEEGEVYGVIGISTDITERKQMEDDLRVQQKALASSQAKSEFIANMSHDIRTPITGMLGLIQEMINAVKKYEILEGPTAIKSDAFEDYRKALNTIIETIHHDTTLLMASTDELLSFCNEILDIMCLDSGKTKQQKVAFNIQALCEKNKQLLMPVAKNKGPLG